MDAAPPPATAAPPDPPPAHVAPYVYSPADIGPRQARERELCARASRFDWVYTGGAGLGLVAGVYLNTQHFKQSTSVPVRLAGPAIIGFFWGGLLGGGYLSLPKCDDTWAYGSPPEGSMRASWPAAAAIALVATATAPAMDYIFLGPVKPDWAVLERSSRILVAMGTGLVGSLLPYLLPPRTWAARKEIERIRIEGTVGGAILGYGGTF